LYTLDVSGLLQRQVSGGWQDLSSGVSRIAIRNRTSLYYLSGTNLYVDGALNFAHTLDFAIDAYGTLYTLDVSGLLQKQVPGGWLDLASGVSRVAVRHDTSLYYLSGTDLYVDGGLNYAHTRDFAVDSFGTLYALDVSGLLQQQIPGGWQDLGNGVSEIHLGNG